MAQGKKKEAVQKTLDGNDIAKLLNGSSNFSDPIFTLNKKLPVHRWVPWIAGFSKTFVDDALEKYGIKNGTVMDPFSGVGTTLVEAILSGNDAIGFEINDYAAFACKVKTTAYRMDLKNFETEISRFSNFYRDCITTGYVPTSQPPAGFKTRVDFYNPAILRKVLIAQDFIDTISDSLIRDIFRLAFASTMVSYSNYSYEPSLSTREATGKAVYKDFPVYEVLIKKLEDMLDDIKWYKANLPEGKEPCVKIINDTFFNYASHIKMSSVDFIATSPPYLNNYHYNRNTRPQLFWLKFVAKSNELKRLEHLNFGTYWQTAREVKKIDLNFDYPELSLLIEQIRGKNPEKGQYGGNGWANYAASYFNDCEKFAQGIYYALKQGGFALVVIGNSILQGVMIPTDVVFSKIAERSGLEIVKIEVPRAARIGNSIIKSDVRVCKAESSHALYESVVELRKP